MSHPLHLFVPAATPFRADLSPDPDRFVTHCRSLLEDGADGLAALGTGKLANLRVYAEGVYEIEGRFGQVTLVAERPALMLSGR